MKALAIPLALLSSCAAQPVAAKAVQVIEVLDGDTFTISGQWAVVRGGKVVFTLPGTVKVRALGIDTPELPNHQPKCAAEGQFALQAKAFATRLLASGPVNITAMQFDKYGGRMDAIITVAGRDYGAAMTSAGFARPYTGDGAKPDWCSILKAGNI